MVTADAGSSLPPFSLGVMDAYGNWTAPPQKQGVAGERASCGDGFMMNTEELQVGEEASSCCCGGGGFITNVQGCGRWESRRHSDVVVLVTVS